MFGANPFGWPYFGQAYAGTAVVRPGFIASVTQVYHPTLQGTLRPGFIASRTVVYAPSLTAPEIHPGFIGSRTRVWPPHLYDPNQTFVGTGNGGETMLIRLAPNGSSVTATLETTMGLAATTIRLSGYAGMPTDRNFVVTVGDEVLLLMPLGIGAYFANRAWSNTTAAVHAPGDSVTWGDSYDMALKATENIDAGFTAAIADTPSFTYPGWLMCFETSQGYLADGTRYSTHVAEVLGVFDAGAGSSGSNRCDAVQPNAIATPYGVTDHCASALSNPSRISTDIVSGDVALIRYTNHEGVVIDLGPRSPALQSWFGLKRVDAADNDVTFTDPDGYVVDSIVSGPSPVPFSGSVEADYDEPIPLQIGIAPDASDAAGHAVPTPSPVAWMTATLPASQRHFTRTAIGEKGWPIGVVAVRQGNRRVPFWQSWDWHNYNYVYTGFGPDCNFAQIIINRNGIVFGSVPVVEFPNDNDVDGPDVVWDDPTYYFSTSWYVVIFSGPYIVLGPGIGGGGPGGAGGGGVVVPVPIVSFPPGGPPTITVPPIEGGSGGNVGGPLSAPSISYAFRPEDDIPPAPTDEAIPAAGLFGSKFRAGEPS